MTSPQPRPQEQSVGVYNGEGEDERSQFVSYNMFKVVYFIVHISGGHVHFRNTYSKMKLVVHKHITKIVVSITTSYSDIFMFANVIKSNF